jgi:hypothetical protein
VLTLLVAAGVAAARWPVSVTADIPDSLRWVRTVDGWERSETLLPAPTRELLLHPAVVASFQLFGAGLALAAGARRRDKQTPAAV